MVGKSEGKRHGFVWAQIFSKIIFKILKLRLVLYE